jgi:aspartyl aminopeptidase
MNGGVIIKTNANQRYTSNAPTTFLVRRLAEIKGVPLQEFEVRNDGSCGSTIGPVGSTMGLRTVDIGLPQLSMHSCRETAGTKVSYRNYREAPERRLILRLFASLIGP